MEEPSYMSNMPIWWTAKGTGLYNCIFNIQWLEELKRLSSYLDELRDQVFAGFAKQLKHLKLEIWEANL
jgi:hypothetical protein